MLQRARGTVTAEEVSRVLSTIESGGDVPDDRSVATDPASVATGSAAGPDGTGDDYDGGAEETDLQFVPSPKELRLINLGNNPRDKASSLIVLGRSGTGKTTCLVFRMYHFYKVRKRLLQINLAARYILFQLLRLTGAFAMPIKANPRTLASGTLYCSCCVRSGAMIPSTRKKSS
jgi:hypothetical protein